MVYVITGGPGFGKTTILNFLAEKGYPVCPENARSVMTQLNGKGESGKLGSLPSDFEKIIAEKRADFLSSINEDVIAFSDRGLPDQVAYSRYKNKMPSQFIMELATSNRYAPFVFVTPPWIEIYTKDEIRQEEFKDALEIHHQIVNAYLQYGYKIINLPLTIPEERVKFILNFLGI